METPERDAAVERLERQVERGSLFTHTALSDNAERLNEVEAFVYGVVDVLVGKGMAAADEIAGAAEKVRAQMEDQDETSAPGIALRHDQPAPGGDDFVPVNCAERIHVCKAVCCKLSFALTPDEVESGTTKWDLGSPYHIRQEADGYCTHNDPATRGCGIYGNRPGICRRYSCAGDGRIWADFERMELNHEWIERHLGGSRPRLVRLMMTGPAAAAGRGGDPGDLPVPQ
jgi:Fe-S-cluster containining protein